MTETKKAKGGNQIIRLALILFIVSAITSGVLGLRQHAHQGHHCGAGAHRDRAEAYKAVLPYDGGYTDVDL